MREPEGQPVHRLEVLALCIAAAVIIVCCVVDSQRRLFWADETLTALAVGDESLSHMLTGLRDEINAMPPLYFVLGWIWARVFGISELSLRLPSALCVVVGMVAIWAALRRLTNRWAATLCAITLPLLCEKVCYNLCEARCYALYFAAYATAVALYLLCATKRDRSLFFYVGVAFVHGALVAVHYVGGLFSAVLVVAALLSWWLDRDVRFLRYGLSAALGWMAVIPSFPFLLAQRKLATEYNWIGVPGIMHLTNSMNGYLELFPLIATLLLLSWLVAEWIDGSGVYEKVARRPGRDVRHVALLLVVTLVFLPAVWLESQWGARIFFPRYLFLISVTWVVAIGCAFGYLFERLWGPGKESTSRSTSGAVPGHDRQPWLRIAGRSLVCVTVGLLLIGAFATLTRFRSPASSLESHLAAVREYPDCPVMTRHIHDFVNLSHYLPLGRQVFLLTDEWHSSLITGIRIGLAMERHYYPDSMRNLPEFLASHDRFLIIDADGAVSQSLANEPEWDGRKITDGVWLWQRRQQ